MKREKSGKIAEFDNLSDILVRSKLRTDKPTDVTRILTMRQKLQKPLYHRRPH